jgi:hypothetical protein
VFFPFAGIFIVRLDKHNVVPIFFFFFFFLGTLGEIIPCLRLGRRVIASDVDQQAWKSEREALEKETKLHLVGNVDLLQHCTEALITTDDEALVSKGQGFLYGLQELPFPISWTFGQGITRQDQEDMFGLVIKDITYNDIAGYQKGILTLTLTNTNLILRDLKGAVSVNQMRWRRNGPPFATTLRRVTVEPRPNRQL